MCVRACLCVCVQWWCLPLLQTGRSRGFAFVYFKDVDDAVDVSDRQCGVSVSVRGVGCDGECLRDS